MWGFVLGLALLTGLDPLRVGLILLLTSRPRPVQNLLVYWAGAMVASVSYLLVLLAVLHATPIFRSFAHDVTTLAAPTSATVRHIQVGIGVFVLSMAALMAVRSRVRRPAQLLASGATTPARAVDSTSPLPARADVPTESGSALRRLLDRARRVWDGESLWVALAMGVLGVPPPVTVLLVLTTIMATGAGIGMQVGAVIAFVAGVHAVVEVAVISHVVMPAKTHAVMRLLHDWTLVHRQKIVVAMCAVIGVALVIQGMRGV